MLKVKKERADVLLVEQGFFASREQAKRAIMAGTAYGNEMRIDKPGEKIPVDLTLSVKGHVQKYVSRGGFKLERAIEMFNLNLEDLIVLDVGASTGGFTDCALQNGAKLVYAVDVGYNQLAWSLRQDERVEVMERINFRHAEASLFTKGEPEFVTIDVSFISLRLILPVVKEIAKAGALISALVKPQFEAGKDNVGKKGIVRDPAVHMDVLNDMLDFCRGAGLDVRSLTYSGITGGDGNIEFLILLENVKREDDTPGTVDEKIDVTAVVKEAHQVLRK